MLHIIKPHTNGTIISFLFDQSKKVEDIATEKSVALKGHKYVIDTAGITKSHRLVIDTAGVTKSHTLVIDTAHARKAQVC